MEKPLTNDNQTVSKGPVETVIPPVNWRSDIASAIDSLKLLAGTTEEDFLQIGSRLQEFYQQSVDINSMSNHLLENVSGELVQSLLERLRGMMSDMDSYLTSARSQCNESCAILERISGLLGQTEQPLVGFHKMYKTLRMLGISTKIESSRIGEKGLGFLTLAMDVERLSHLVNDKSASILGHCHELGDMIRDNLVLVQAAGVSQDQEVSQIFRNISASVAELVLVNDNCSQFGSMAAMVSDEVSANIGEVVSSMQAHDITRQQVEHVIEALQRVTSDLGDPEQADVQAAVITEVGDVCELQEVQLRHSSSELNSAVQAIIENLRAIADKQAVLSEQTITVVSGDSTSGRSFVEDIKSGMHTVTEVLSRCAGTDRELTATMQKVAETIGEISAFVEDIEEIGSEIDLIALNSQIMAAHTGMEGAALGVLAEAIKRLSLDAVIQTEAVSKTLMEVRDVTGHMLCDNEQESGEVSARIAVMEGDLTDILGELSDMNEKLYEHLSALGSQVTGLSQSIGQVTGSIQVHDRFSDISSEVFGILQRIVSEAREIVPASSEFVENLRHMEERYTMQSERNIHETVVRNRNGEAAVAVLPAGAVKNNQAQDSGFGDNVDLF